MNDALLNAVSYAQLYLENRIMECKSAGECTKDYEQELADIRTFWMAELKKVHSEKACS